VEAIGSLQATIVTNEGRRTAYVAWVVGVPWQGRGFASEAARAVVAWLRERGADEIRAHIRPGHGASEAVAARAGLEPCDEYVAGERVWRTSSVPAGQSQSTSSSPMNATSARSSGDAWRRRTRHP